jgi:hypothetical protein
VRGSEVASRVGEPVYHGGQGQDERSAPTPERPTSCAALTRRGLEEATHTGSRERGGGPRQTLERHWERLTVGRGDTAGTVWATPLEQRHPRLPRDLAALDMLNRAGWSRAVWTQAAG